jgi:hypothetical protein
VTLAARQSHGEYLCVLGRQMLPTLESVLAPQWSSTESVDGACRGAGTEVTAGQGTRVTDTNEPLCKRGKPGNLGWRKGDPGG